MDLLAQAGLIRARPRVIAAGPVTLRPVGAGDAGALVAGMGNYDVARWLAGMPYPFGLPEAERFLASPEAAPGRCWGICDGAGLQGLILFGEELGFWLARPVWGRGYLFQAASAAIARHFTPRRAGDLVARHFAQNTRSARVLERLGFAVEAHETRLSLPLNQYLPTRRMRLTRPRWHALSRAA